MITVVAILLVGVLCACAGAFGGYWLVFRRLDRELFPVVANARASAGRANTAAATVEEIATHWPGVLERVEALDGVARKAALNAQEAKQKSGDMVARQDALEQAIAGALGVSVRGG